MKEWFGLVRLAVKFLVDLMISCILVYKLGKMNYFVKKD